MYVSHHIMRSFFCYQKLAGWAGGNVASQFQDWPWYIHDHNLAARVLRTCLRTLPVPVLGNSSITRTHSGRAKPGRTVAACFLSSSSNSGCRCFGRNEELSWRRTNAIARSPHLWCGRPTTVTSKTSGCFASSV